MYLSADVKKEFVGVERISGFDFLGVEIRFATLGFPVQDGDERPAGGHNAYLHGESRTGRHK